MWIGLIHAALGDKERAFVWLEKAYQARSDTLLFLKVDPKYDSLRSDPRFSELVKRLNLGGPSRGLVPSSADRHRARSGRNISDWGIGREAVRAANRLARRRVKRIRPSAPV